MSVETDALSTICKYELDMIRIEKISFLSFNLDDVNAIWLLPFDLTKLFACAFHMCKQRIVRRQTK